MTLVVAASVVVAALVDGGDVGRWAEEVLLSDHLTAQHLLSVEVANILGRASLAGEITPDVAALAPAELQAHVALAEFLDGELATLDRRLARASGTACRFLLPPG